MVSHPSTLLHELQCELSQTRVLQLKYFLSVRAFEAANRSSFKEKPRPHLEILAINRTFMDTVKFCSSGISGFSSPDKSTRKKRERKVVCGLDFTTRAIQLTFRHHSAIKNRKKGKLQEHRAPTASFYPFPISIAWCSCHFVIIIIIILRDSLPVQPANISSRLSVSQSLPQRLLCSTQCENGQRCTALHCTVESVRASLA